MQNKVLELIEELGFNVLHTSAVYGIENARAQAEREGLAIVTMVTSKGLDVWIHPCVRGVEFTIFRFEKGKRPYLLLHQNTPEIREFARRFGEVADSEL